MQQNVRLAEPFQHVGIFRQRAEKFYARSHAGLRGGLFQFMAERPVVDNPQFGVGIFFGELGEGADGEIKSFPMDVPTDANRAERARRRRGQRGELREIGLRQRHLRQLFHTRRAEAFQRSAAFARDADSDSCGARCVA